MAISQGGSKLVLIVDDERDLLDLINYVVRKDGLRTELAKDGATALERIAFLKPDLIILDLLMPRMSGVAVLNQMKTGSAAKIPVIVLTAAGYFARKENVAQFPNVVAVLEKPVPNDRLRSAILTALGRAAT